MHQLVCEALHDCICISVMQAFPQTRQHCRIATLREAFKNTPKWLGFNIELKYPTEAQLAAMPFRFYSRNYFVDSILKVEHFGNGRPRYANQ